MSITNCTDGEARLVDGPSTNKGRLEICHNQAWATVCNSGFSTEESRVVCAQLGFQRYGNTIIKLIISTAKFSGHKCVGATSRTNVYGQGIGPIYGFSCRGTESSLSSCSVQSHQTIVACSHSRDVSVDCEGKILIIACKSC